MNTVRFLTDPATAGAYWPIILAGLGIAVCTSALSVVVVLKRLAFIGQGVSHAGFGGVGLAFALGITGVAAVGASPGQVAVQELGLLAILLVFCIASALGIARLSRSGKTGPDTAIGIVLVVGMAVGALLLQMADGRAERAGIAPPPEMEEVLFGSLASVGWVDAAIAWTAAVVCVVTLAGVRRSLLFAAFDESAAESFGLPVERLRSILLVLLAIAIVVTMRLAGVVMATAMLVLPGATALRLNARLSSVLVWSLVVAVVGTLGGLVLSFETGWQPGPAIVFVLVAVFAAVCSVGRLRSG